MNDPHRLGEALAFTEHAPHVGPSSPWQQLSARISDEALRARVEYVAAALHSPGSEPVDARTAASTEHFGLVARLVAAHICGRALGFWLDLSASSIWWQQLEGGLLSLSFTRSEPRDPLRDNSIKRLTDTVQRLYGVSPHVLWGNVGSAANSTLSLLRTTRPDLLPAARRAADELLSDPRIDGGRLRSGPDFRRRSCCLIYRAGTAVCGDCVLRH